MTLEEAIKRCEEVAEELDMKADFETDNQRYAMSESERTELKECVKDHRQLAEWLKELKAVHDVQDVPDTNVGDMVSKKAVELALIEKGWSSKIYKIGEIWELNADEIREALATVPPAQPEPRWIPCEERPPEESGIYLTKDSFGSMRKRWYTTVDGWGRAKDMPTAWMPLSGVYS